MKRQAKAERRRARRVAAKLAEMEALETRLRHANAIACVLVAAAGASVGRNVATGTVGRDLASLRLRGGGSGDRVLRSRVSSKKKALKKYTVRETTQENKKQAKKTHTVMPRAYSLILSRMPQMCETASARTYSSSPTVHARSCLALPSWHADMYENKC